MPPLNTNVSRSGSSTSGGARLTGAQPKGASSGGTNSSQNFEKGQVFKGEVVDLRNHETKILLNDSRIVSARLDKHMDLSIGQSAAFQVTKASPSGICLKIVGNQAQHMIDNTVDKALEEAGLPKLDHNIEAVKELLKNQLSIDKNTIYRLLQHAAAFKDTSLAALAQMMKYNIPMTEVNASQMEAYRNYEHRLVPQLCTLVDSIAAEFTSDDSSIRSNLILNQALLPMLSDTGRLPMEGMIPSYPNEQILELADLIGAKDPALCIELLNGTASLRDTAIAIQSAVTAITTPGQDPLLPDAVPVVFQPAISDPTVAAPAVQEEDIAASLLAIPASADLPEAFSIPIVHDILERFTTQQMENGETAAFLTAAERELLSQKLSFLPLPKLLHDNLKSGDLTGSQLVREVRNALVELANSTPQKTLLGDLESLLSSSEYNLLLKSELVRHWTISPKELQKGLNPEHFYEKLEQELSKLTTLTNHSGSFGSSRQFGQDAQNLRENIDFMKTLNGIFSYVQLPLQLSGKNIHSELYVYTKKEALRKDKQNISVLLHLDMEELGPMDVRIELNHASVSAKFYIETPPAIRLIQDNLSILENALKLKGFTFYPEVHQKEQKTDIVKDFIAPDVPVGTMKRYSFDIRA